MSTSHESQPTCREIVELVTDYLEGTMPLAERARFEEHVAWCEPCRGYLAQMRQTIRLTGGLSEEAIPPGVRDELVEAFRGWREA